MSNPRLDPDRTIYDNAPLKLVACEIGYALAPGADLAVAQNGVYEALGDQYPLPGPAPAQLTVQFGPAGAAAHQASQGFRFLDRERTKSITASPNSLLLEVSRYSRFEEFIERVAPAVNAVGERVRIAAVTRIGLRYIDEIAKADLPDGSFEGYFTESVLAPGQAVPGAGAPEEFMTTTRFAVASDTNAVMRTGVLRTPVVAPEGPLSIQDSPTGPFFLIDIDSAWQATTTPPIPFDAAAIIDVLGSLHAPIRSLFEHSITDKLRSEVLRKEVTP